MVRVLINGCNGKMGQVVADVIERTPDIEVLCGVDIHDTGDNKFPVYTRTSDIQEVPDVIIDFSVPEATFKILEYAREKKVSVVIATTGFSEEQTNQIMDYSKEIAIFKAANMSYEINLMAKLVADLSKKLPNSDIEIIETHHNRKIDSPSGTAYFLADSINNAQDNSLNYVFDRHSKREKRTKKEIGIHSIRGGNEVGKHTVIFFGENESLEITHNVNSRAVFAEGAAKAAFFVAHKDNGFYNMNDL